MRKIALIYSPKKLVQAVTKIMMPGYITSKGRGILLPVNGSITSEKYYQVLQDGLLPVINWYYADANFVLDQNNAPCLNSSESRSWLDDRQIRVKQWPSQSPDINIIENIWKWMKLEQQKHIEKITSRQDLVNVLQYIWRKFEVILNRKRVAQTIYDYIINILARAKMINMLRKGIKFSIQRVYFPQSYFESRHYGKRFNSIGKFKSLTFQ